MKLIPITAITMISIALGGGASAAEITATTHYLSGDGGEPLFGDFTIPNGTSVTTVDSLTITVDSDENYTSFPDFTVYLDKNSGDPVSSDWWDYNSTTNLQSFSFDETSSTVVGYNWRDQPDEWSYTFTVTGNSNFNSAVKNQLQNNDILYFAVNQSDCDLTFESATLDIDPPAVPDGASTMSMLGLGLLGISAAARRLGIRI
ncbi:MAG: hypothetical protein ABSA05_12035 [Opitutaceae bacterium]|jgi:hypothetical protein